MSADASVFGTVLHVGSLRSVDGRFVVAMEGDRKTERVFDLLSKDLKPFELKASLVCGKIFGVEGRARDGTLLATSAKPEFPNSI